MGQIVSDIAFFSLLSLCSCHRHFQNDLRRKSELVDRSCHCRFQNNLQRNQYQFARHSKQSGT